MKHLVRLVLLLVVGGILTGIYIIKVETWQLRKEARSLQKQIIVEERAITILRAEEAYLKRPARIERLAREHLKMGPAKPAQITVLDK